MRERTGEGAHTQRRGARAPLQAEAHRRPERGWVQLEDTAPSSGPRLWEKGGPTRGRRTPEGSGPHPWPPTCASRCLNRFTAPRPRAAQNRGGGGFLPFWSLLPREAPGVRAARLRGSAQSGQEEPPCSRQPPRTLLLTRRDTPSALGRGMMQKVSGREVPQSSTLVVSTRTIPHLVAPSRPQAPSLTL